MFRSNVSSMFLYFVVKVFDDKTGKVCNRVNGWQYFRCISIIACQHLITVRLLNAEGVPLMF